MFLKNFRVKSNTAIRGSDRRKLRSDVLRELPYFNQESISEVIPNKEEMSVMKIMTHSGQNATAYILSGSPILFQVETKLYPTVYLLWKYPDMLPTFTTWPNVFEKINGGADLMLPGVISTDNSPMEFQKGDVCSVTLLGNKAPVAVGYTALSSSEALEQGMRGKGVIILHSYRDQLWSQGTKRNIPVIEPATSNTAEASQPVDTDKMLEVSGIQRNIVEVETNENTLTDKNVDEHSTTRDDVGGVEGGNTTSSLNSKVEGINITDNAQVLKGESECSDVTCLSSKDDDNEEVSLPNEHSSPGQPRDNTTENECTVDNPSELMDKQLERCFLHAVLNIKKNDLPILTSTFYKNYLLPCCPPGQTLDIKKSSYKKLTKFLQVMEKKRFITMKEQSKGVHTIDCINWENEDLRNFKKQTSSQLQENSNVDEELTENTDFKPPEIEELLSVSGNTQPLFKDLGYSKGAILSAKDVRQIITDYVKSQELVSSENKRKVLLDPVLFSVVHKKEERNIDCLAWDELFRRVIERMNPCHKVTFNDQPPIIRKGKLQPIEIKVQQRMGNKKVTLVHNLEYYGIDPGEFAHKLQLKAASSTSVSQFLGKPNAGQQVLIQGNQVHHVATTLRDDYQIATKYINGLDQLKQSGRKKK